MRRAATACRPSWVSRYWSQGTLSLSPVWSNGRLLLDNVSADTLRAWLGGHLPWSVKSGRLTFETAYQFAHDNQGIALATRDGQLSATRLELADHEQPDQVLASADTLAMQGWLSTWMGRSW